MGAWRDQREKIHGAGFLARDGRAELERAELERAELDRAELELGFRVLLVAAVFLLGLGPSFIALAATSFTAAAAIF